jgi:chemotaxis signal transduction protein
VPASAVVKIAAKPKIARLAGAPPGVLGIARFESELIPVVALGPVTRGVSEGSPAMVVCTHGGEQLGVLGIDVVSSGTFALDDGDGVMADDGTRVETLDVEKIFARLRTTMIDPELVALAPR